jgi:hypothetical protein
MNIAKIVVPLLLLSGLPAARASILLTLETPSQTAVPGQTLTFLGTISNLYNAPVDLNQIAITLTGPFAIETSMFFDASAPLSVAAAPGTTGSYAWFTLTVDNPYPGPFGPVGGTVSILGGVQGPGGYDPTTLDLLASVGFTVNVTAATPLPPAPPVSGEVPEPSTWALFAAGSGLIWWMRRGSRKFDLKGAEASRGRIEYRDL